MISTIYLTLNKWLGRVRKEQISYILFYALLLNMASGALFYIAERDIPFFKAIWWSVVTMTTVGYGDVYPVTGVGMVIAVFNMVLGIGLISTITAWLAGVVINRRLKEDQGMRKVDFKDHVIVCEWNERAESIIEELRSDVRMQDVPIVLIADNITSKPVDDENLYFVFGEVCEKALEKACVKKARTIIILGDERLEGNNRDAKVVLTTLAVETLNPKAYTIVELVHGENRVHCERANADEVIVGGYFRSRLVARVALDHGLSKVLTELLSSNVGNNLEKMAVPGGLDKKTFADIAHELTNSYRSILLGVERDEQLYMNPGPDFVVRQSDLLTVIRHRN